MKEEITDPFIDSIRYCLQCYDNNTLFLNDSPPFKVPNSAAKLSEVKPISLEELRKNAEILSEHRIQSMMERAEEKLQYEIKEHFEKLLERKNISAEEWRKYGTLYTKENIMEFHYKDECIFVINGPVYNLPTDSNPTEGSCSYYYWETDK